MELTRRDAILALAGGSVAVSAKSISEGYSRDQTQGIDGLLSTVDVDTLVAVAGVLYPTKVEPTPEFVETYMPQRFAGRGVELRSALKSLRDTARRETGRQYVTLDPGRQDAVLRATGADRAYPDPEGTTPQRLRYYIVNGLLYALYSTPRGAALVGSSNPRGYPGGQEAYQRRPDR